MTDNLDPVVVPIRFLAEDGEGQMLFGGLPPEMGNAVTCPHCGDRAPLLVEGPVATCMRVVCTTCGAAGPLIRPGYGAKIARYQLHLEADEEVPEPTACAIAAYAVWAARLSATVREELRP